MIKKIEIKDIATFDHKGIEIDELKKVNVIYGSNGTGKSTVSKVLAQVHKFPQCHIDGKMEFLWMCSYTTRNSVKKIILSRCLGCLH